MVQKALVLTNPYSAAKYNLFLDIAPSKPNFQGELTIDLVSNSRYIEDTKTEEESCPLSLTLNCANIVVTNAEFSSEDGKVVEKANISYERAKEHVTFTPILNSASFEGLSALKLKLNYLAKISTIKTHQDLTAGVFKTNYLNGLTGKADNYIVSTHCQPKYAKWIFPCIEDLSSKPIMELSIKTDINFTCVSNSSIANTEILDDVKKLVKFQPTPPMNMSVFGFVVGDLEYVEQFTHLKSGNQVSIRVYTPIGELENASYPLNIAALALPELEKLLHHPYPLDKLDFVALPFLSDSAMEDWGLIQVQQSFLLVEPEVVMAKNQDSQVQLCKLREVVIHELVHQWVGNLVTFDDWSHIWLNEAFATFTAWACMVSSGTDNDIWLKKCNSDFQKMMDNESLPTANPIFIKHALEVRTTADALSQEAYFKGIPLLRMLANFFDEKLQDSFDDFFEMIGLFLDEWKLKAFKPTDLWTFMTKCHSINKNKIDAATMMHSWTRTAGYPILNASVNKDNKLVISQHRYLHGLKAELDDSFEDVPFHVPVTCRMKDGSVMRSVMSDRSKTFDIDIANLVTINANYCSIIRVQYCKELYHNIAEQIEQNKLTHLDLLAIMNDLSKLIGSVYQTESEALAVLEITNAFSNKTTVLSFEATDILLNILQNLVSASRLVKGADHPKTTKFASWCGKVIVSMQGKLAWSVKEVNYSTLSKEELRSRNSILMLGAQYAPSETSAIIKDLYKNLMHGPKQSIPLELANSIFTSTLMRLNSAKEYKEILSLAKAPGLTVSNLIPRAGQDMHAFLQTSAVLALGYVSQKDLVTKTLNFVMTNIDSKLIELALVGLQAQNDNIRGQLWDWYELHYNTWCVKSFREGSAYAKQLKVTLTNITKIVFGSIINKDKKKLDRFVKAKMNNSLYKRFDVQQILEEVEMENEEKIKLCECEKVMVSWIENH